MRALTAAAYWAGGLNALGLLFAELAMRPGAPMVPTPARVGFLASGPWGWTLGWGVWMLAALAVVVFFALLARHVRGPFTLIALLLVCMGAAVDLMCDATQMAVLPAVAATDPPPHTLFLTVDRVCWAGGVIVACGLYCLAVGVVTVALHRERRAGLAVVLTGAATCLPGLVWVWAEIVEARSLLEPATGATVGAFVLWVLVVPPALRARVPVRATRALQRPRDRTGGDHGGWAR